MIFRLASPSDDAQLRRLMRENVMPGHIRMVYAREPNFFAGQHDDTQTIVADHNGDIVGMGSRTCRRLYLNGRAQRFGYLSGLRLSPSAQHGTALARGYSFLKQLHADGQAPAYLTTIIHGNGHASETLTSGRAGLPAYRHMGRYLTQVFPVRKHPLHAKPQDPLVIGRATDVPAVDLSAFLAAEGAKRQFFPVAGVNGEISGLLKQVGVDNVLVAQEGGAIVGTMAIWDQGQHKQHIVDGYSRLFRCLVPFVNLFLRLRGCHALPLAGQQVRYATVALVCIRHDDPRVFRALFQSIMAKASAAGLHQVAVGMHAHDPLRACLRKRFRVIYRSGLYLVSWEDTPLCRSLDDTFVPYMELGTL
ncbi:MAG: hypothetical protein HN919_19445 [Verrucomicrobia bacterium]|jgi:hypothetical protein|nr:hypothetical protein [Verrucomicrobiota bacterium]MBT7068478.1 hypothetical protein [Verrucomicrobiota bacterium]MBT7701131.1 hypothetical protein [Verrucomicrobiota bacterium]